MLAIHFFFFCCVDNADPGAIVAPTDGRWHLARKRVLRLHTECLDAVLASDKCVMQLEPFPPAHLTRRTQRERAAHFQGTGPVKIDAGALANKDFAGLGRAVRELRESLEHVAENSRGMRVFRELQQNASEDALRLARFAVATAPPLLVLRAGIGPHCCRLVARSATDIYCLPVGHPARDVTLEAHGPTATFLMHGFPLAAAWSIVRNGPRTLSSTSLRATGAAYGSGVYTSRLCDTARHYGVRGFVGIVETRGVLPTQMESDRRQIHVFADDTSVALRFMVRPADASQELFDETDWGVVLEEVRAEVRLRHSSL